MHVREHLVLIGPNRRSERTIIERQIVFSDEELEALESRLSSLFGRLVAILESLSVPTAGCLEPERMGIEGVLGDLAWMFTGTALALQRAAGHRVNYCGHLPDGAGQGVWAWFEFEHEEVGIQAAILALWLLAESEPVLDWQDDEPDFEGELSGIYQRFLDSAKPLVFPVDADAIMYAAQARDIPCFKLERIPYVGAQGGFRVRPNGLLKLGHCRHQNVVDGTLCITRNSDLLPFVRDREALRQRLSPLKLPWPRRDENVSNCVVTRRAIRAANYIGYPVVVKPGIRAQGKGTTLNVNSAQEMPDAVERARNVSSRVIVEAMVTGKPYLILLVNHQVVGIVGQGRELTASVAHESVLALAKRVSAHLEIGMLTLSIVTADLSLPMAETGGAVVDVDLAPRLDLLLPKNCALLQQAADAFVRWMYPEGTGRIPIVAVTGTNGKTTTCRMISSIMQLNGSRTGMVCSTGVYVAEKFEATRGDFGYGAYHRIFEHEEVDFAVFEEYFGRIVRQGFSYAWCNVAVCTNVTEDHLGRVGVHTLEQMAEVKATVLRRARDAVVLNADNRYCMQMAYEVKALKICLVSCEQNRQQLAEQLPETTCFVVLESVNGADWIVIYDGEFRNPLLAVDDIPATFSGTAAHNTVNAMQAAAACYLSGAELEKISRALANFRMDIETNPCRLNIIDELPFRVIIDYAHNADGFRKLSAFIDKQQVKGRKIVMLNVAGDRRDEDIIAAARELAGHFDHFVCRNYVDMRGRMPEEVPRLLKAGLLEAGVSEGAVSIVEDAIDALHFSLEIARPEDLLVLLPGENDFDYACATVKSFQPVYSDSTTPSASTK